MQKLAWIVVILMGLGAASLPVANLVLDQPASSVQQQLAAIQDPQFKQAATILQGKCAHCHASGTPKPFYANFPIASSLIEQDVREGLARFDFADKLQGSGEAFSEIDLARLEHVLNDGSMPPLRYTALHWRAFLGANERDSVLGWLYKRRKAMQTDPSISPALSAEPVAPIPSSIPANWKLNPDKIALGEKLFHDNRLSADNTISCASCHALDKGGTDQARFSTGIRNQVGGINSPTVYNAVFHFVQFWDGRSADLREQAHGPVSNPIEMGSNWPQVISKLNQDPTYIQAFQRHYPDGITGDNIVDAIVAFEKTLITPHSRFDRYLRGEQNALKPDELAGYQLFKTHCASCHAGVNLGGLSYEKMGWRRDYFTKRGDIKQDDFGRFNVTKWEADKFFFKVPTLRNISLTWPYFHDGSTSDLREAVKIMATHQVNEKLNEREIDQITAFLRTLTGEYDGRPLPEKSSLPH